MGLPLYIAPVTSDLRRKSTSHVPSAQDRSAIRRLRRHHRAAETVRENRRQALITAASQRARQRQNASVAEPFSASARVQYADVRELREIQAAEIDPEERARRMRAWRRRFALLQGRQLEEDPEEERAVERAVEQAAEREQVEEVALMRELEAILGRVSQRQQEVLGHEQQDPNLEQLLRTRDYMLNLDGNRSEVDSDRMRLSVRGRLLRHMLERARQHEEDQFDRLQHVAEGFPPPHNSAPTGHTSRRGPRSTDAFIGTDADADSETQRGANSDSVPSSATAVDRRAAAQATSRIGRPFADPREDSFALLTGSQLDMMMPNLREEFGRPDLPAGELNTAPNYITHHPDYSDDEFIDSHSFYHLSIPSHERHFLGIGVDITANPGANPDASTTADVRDLSNTRRRWAAARRRARNLLTPRESINDALARIADPPQGGLFSPDGHIIGRGTGFGNSTANGNDLGADGGIHGSHGRIGRNSRSNRIRSRRINRLPLPHEEYLREVDNGRNNNTSQQLPPIRSLFGTHVDGLGDRRRSLTPDGDSAWDTLRTTLTPDPQPPSLGSSFASAAAPVTSTAPVTVVATASVRSAPTGAVSFSAPSAPPPAGSAAVVQESAASESLPATRLMVPSTATVAFESLSTSASRFATGVTFGSTSLLGSGTTSGNTSASTSQRVRSPFTVVSVSTNDTPDTTDETRIALGGSADFVSFLEAYPPRRYGRDQDRLRGDSGSGGDTDLFVVPYSEAYSNQGEVGVDGVDRGYSTECDDFDVDAEDDEEVADRAAYMAEINAEVVALYETGYRVPEDTDIVLRRENVTPQERNTGLGQQNGDANGNDSS